MAGLDEILIHEITELNSKIRELEARPRLAFTTGTYVLRSTSPLTNELYYSTDYKAFFVYNGSAWDQVSTGNFSAFPASPINGLKVFHTGYNMEFKYNGTRWLSTTFVDTEISPRNFANAAPAPAQNGYLVCGMPVLSDYDIWVERVEALITFYSNQSASAYYNLLVTGATSLVPTTQSYTAGGTLQRIVVVNTGYLVTASTNKDFELDLQTATTNNPGTVEFKGKIRYRLIGT